MRGTHPFRLLPFVALSVAVGIASSCARPQPVLDTRGLTPQLTLPLKDNSLRLAAIGDSGTGDSAQYRVASWMSGARQRFPFEFVLMMGDNLYGSEDRGAYERKFSEPYGPLLEAGVDFYATLGNHDETSQSLYELFNMSGERYYSFKPRDGVRFFALDTNYLSPEQLEWFEGELAASGSDWKIVFFHHPIYSSGGKHGSDVQLRAALEPIFVEHGVDVVFQGHDHFYERVKPQKGIHYFVSGAAAKLRRGDVDPSTAIHAVGFDQGYHFMLVEIAGNELHFQVISDRGATIDSGVIYNAPPPAAATD